MTTDIMPTQTPEEEELARKQAELASLEAELAHRELDLVTLRGELHASTASACVVDYNSYSFSFYRPLWSGPVTTRLEQSSEAPEFVLFGTYRNYPFR